MYRRKEKPKKRGLDFSKILAIWAVVIASVTVAVSFLLSAFDKQAVSDLATVIFSTCVGYLVTYAGKSALEKASRNKWGIDADGNPFDKHDGA
jgi:xanthine/uracil permease